MSLSSNSSICWPKLGHWTTYPIVHHNCAFVLDQCYRLSLWFCSISFRHWLLFISAVWGFEGEGWKTGINQQYHQSSEAKPNVISNPILTALATAPHSLSCSWTSPNTSLTQKVQTNSRWNVGRKEKKEAKKRRCGGMEKKVLTMLGPKTWHLNHCSAIY